MRIVDSQHTQVALSKLRSRARRPAVRPPSDDWQAFERGVIDLIGGQGTTACISIHIVYPTPSDGAC